MRAVPAMSNGDSRGVAEMAGRTPWVVEFPSASAVLVKWFAREEARGSSVDG